MCCPEHKEDKKAAIYLVPIHTKVIIAINEKDFV